MIPEKVGAVTALPIAGLPDRAAIEAAAIARFVRRMSVLAPLHPAARALQICVLAEVKRVARALDVRAETGTAAGYARRVLCEIPGIWSLAAVILRPGQQTEVHDHGGWGCAATVQGVERDRRFTWDGAGALVLGEAHDYPPGTGYLFDPLDIHQPLGADPDRVTVALHFLAQE